MNSTAILVHSAPRRSSPTTAGIGRYLYPMVAVLLLGLTFWGFQQFYLQGRTARGAELVGSVRGVLVAHGLAMTLWISLFAAQPLLIAVGNRKLHRTLGFFGAGLAICLVPLGVWTAIAMAKAEPLRLHAGSLNARQFLAIQLNSLLMFAGFAALGIICRRRVEIHRPMLFLATLSVMGAAMARIVPLRELYLGTVWNTWFGPYLWPLIVGLVFFTAKTALTRSFDRWLAGGLAALIIADFLAMKIGPTAIWEHFGQFLVR